MKLIRRLFNRDIPDFVPTSSRLHEAWKRELSGWLMRDKDGNKTYHLSEEAIAALSEYFVEYSREKIDMEALTKQIDEKMDLLMHHLASKMIEDDDFNKQLKKSLLEMVIREKGPDIVKSIDTESMGKTISLLGYSGQLTVELR